MNDLEQLRGVGKLLDNFWNFNFSDIDECLKKIKELTKQ